MVIRIVGRVQHWVGFYDPKGQWESVAMFATILEAAEFLNYVNGGAPLSVKMLGLLSDRY